MNRFVGILGSIAAAIIIFAALNLVKSGHRNPWGVMVIIGIIWGTLTGLCIAFIGSNWPTTTGAIASAILLALSAWLVSYIPNDIVLSNTVIFTALVRSLCVGAFCGFGYGLAVAVREGMTEE